MARFKITTPDGRFEGILGGARFIDGAAEVEDGHAALAYARRRGYTVERLGEPEASEEAPERPGKGDSKAEWVAYVVATSDLSEAEAEDMTKAELIELADNEQ